MQVSTHFGPGNRFYLSGSIVGHSTLDFGRPRFFDSLVGRAFYTFEELACELGAIFGWQVTSLFVEHFHRTGHSGILPRDVWLQNLLRACSYECEPA
jgi:hypothetical protein